MWTFWKCNKRQNCGTQLIPQPPREISLYIGYRRMILPDKRIWMNSLSPHIIFPPQYFSSVYTTFILSVPIQKALRPLTACLLTSQSGTVISLGHHWTPPIHLIYCKQPSNQSPQFTPHKYSRTVFLKQATNGSEFPLPTALMINSFLWHFILQHMAPY